MSDLVRNPEDTFSHDTANSEIMKKDSLTALFAHNYVSNFFSAVLFLMTKHKVSSNS